MDKTNKINHKTLFLLDFSTSFTHRTSEQPIEFDVFTKGRSSTAGIIPLAPIPKSLWTCTVESVLEYSRIVYDLYPEFDKLLSFLVFRETGCLRLIDWTEQNLVSLSNSFAQIALQINDTNSNNNNKSTQPNNNNNNKTESFLLSSINDCLDQLATFSPLQWELYKKKKDQSQLVNKTRLIVITNLQNNNQVNNYIKSLNSTIIEFNKLVNSNDAELNESSKLQINKLHLVLINTYPVNQDSVKVSQLDLQNDSAIFSYEVINTKSGTFFASKMISLLLKHYDLASTTVTGIPMKEEQNSSSSANYDVEIVHSNQAHLDLINNSLSFADQFKSIREGMEYDTVSLKWCTPKGSSVELHQCTGAYRITAVEINSRPSSCLINFLLNGRTVMLMLDMPRVKGKCMSHMLSSHCGELYIHTLCYNTKSIIDDPPSVSEGIGGRVTDYRITDFAELMKSMKLERCRPSTSGELPLEKAKQYLTKQTLYWPMTIGHSIIFNLKNHIQPLLTLIPKDTLTIDEVNDCQNSIYQLVAMENKNAPLPIPSVLPKGKSIKKEEMYKLMWKELEHFIKMYAITPEHNKVLTCLKELNSKFDNTTVTTTSKENLTNSNKKFSLTDESELMWKKEYDRYNDMPDLKRPKLNSTTTETTSTMNKMLKKSLMSGSLSLYSLNAKRLELENTRKMKEFKGRKGGNIAQLYANIEMKPENPL